MARRIGTTILWLGVVAFAFSLGTPSRASARYQNEETSSASVADETPDNEQSETLESNALGESKTPIATKGSASGFGQGGGGSTILTTLGSLALALFAFFGMVAIARILTTRGRRSGASRDLEIAERLRYDAKTELVEVRWRGKSILAVASSSGWRVLAQDDAPSDAEEGTGVSTDVQNETEGK
ncbi:MAG: hypothetical protein IJU03_00290 [Thermoguttaceae bacterium]|nr:hypothetical protein [Thermoguttaceae bacterium]